MGREVKRVAAWFDWPIGEVWEGDESVRVLAYRAVNFKGLKDVRIEPGRHVVFVVGRNGAGKSSVLDALHAALAGARASPGMPVRRGAAEASVRLDLGDVTVTRRWSADGSTRLYVEHPDGSAPRAPQALLDRMLGAVGFDALAFARQDPAEQARTLRRLAGLDAAFAEIDAELAALAEERAEVGRAVRADEGALASYHEGEFEGVPDEAPDAAELAAQYRAAVDAKGENDAVRAAAREDARRLAESRRAYGAACAETERLRELLARAESAERSACEAVSDAQAAASESAAMAEGLEDPDVAGAWGRLREAQATAAKVARKRERADIEARRAGNAEHAAALAGRIDALREKKKDLITRAPLPVPGLDCAGDEVLLRGVPLAQANTAEQVRVGLEVAAALSPHLRVAAIRDGSLLDDGSLAAVCRWAEERDYQVWLERVGPPGGPGAVVIEDGAVAAAPPGEGVGP
jgi:energy-coupling factor transporter ATP-binding protein EcfA2